MLREVYKDPRKVDELIRDLRLPKVDPSEQQKALDQLAAEIEEKAKERLNQGFAQKKKEERLQYQARI